MNQPQQPARSLLRILGLAFGLAVVVGNTIGAGILRTPGDIAGLLPTPVAFLGIWVIGGLYALLGANALSELGTMLPRSGGQFVYARHAFGDYAGFVVGWMDWASTAASASAISIVIGESVASIAGWPRGTASPIAMGVVIVFTVLLLRGTRLGDLTQRVTSSAKALALLVLVAICFVFAHRAHAAAAAPAAAATATGFAALLLAAQAVIYTYDGWDGAIYFSEELDDPDRQIPRSMFYGLLSVALIYLLINVAFMVALPIRAIAGSTLAAGTVAEAIFGARGDLLVRLVVIAALPSAVNACLLMASRVLYSVSREGLGLPVATHVNARGTPTVALAGSGLVALAFLATGTFGSIIAIAAFFFVAAYSLSFVALFVLRAREPNANRPYRAVGHPWTTGFVLLGSLAFLASAVITDRRNSLYALGIVVASYPVFRWSHRPGPTPAPARP
ncbi:MAG TPA: APC family permease [Gemmatimonadaceae bacterium]|jgi:basic amino acid/polyamine antiporter, APA family|nr:APC family permease [Gemmatimonadaceae bacterium]